MKKTVYFLLFLLVSFSTNAQMFEELKKEPTVNDSKIIVTVYSGIGITFYRYDAHRPPIGTINYTSKSKEFVVPVAIPVNANVLFKLGNAYLGPGLDFQKFSGSLQYPTGEKLQLSTLKAVGRLELRYRPGKRVATGFFLQGGGGMAMNAPGENASTLFGGTAGSFWSIKMSRHLNLLLGLSLAFDKFSNTVRNQPSNHSLFTYGLILGLRFGN